MRVRCANYRTDSITRPSNRGFVQSLAKAMRLHGRVCTWYDIDEGHSRLTADCNLLNWLSGLHMVKKYRAKYFMEWLKKSYAIWTEKKTKERKVVYVCTTCDLVNLKSSKVFRLPVSSCWVAEWRTHKVWTWISIRLSGWLAGFCWFNYY